jgi:transcription elongation factor GreB
MGFPFDLKGKVMSQPNYITTRGLERITRELEWLQKEERPKIVREVSYAASLGDRSENSEYLYGKKRLREIDRRLRFLIKRLDNIVVVDPSQQKGPRVLFGATVVVETEEGEEQVWRIFGEDEVYVERGILSWKSPLARAILGKSEGDEVHFMAPLGKRTLEVLEIRYEKQPELPEGLLGWRL